MSQKEIIDLTEEKASPRKKRKTVQSPPAKTWCFTLNNPTDAEVKQLIEWSKESTIKRFVATRESGENDTPHIQGAITFGRAYRFPQLHKLVPRAHWEQAKTKDPGLYCIKTDSEVIVNIDNRSQGSRSDLKALHQDIKNGATRKDLWEKFFPTMCRSYQGVYEGMRTLASEDGPSPEFSLESFPWTPPDQIRSLVLEGESGIGKTQFALALLPKALWVTHMDDLLSFDPSQHTGIIFDDMSFKHMPRTAQIHITDYDMTRSIHCRYRSACIPKHTPKIFTCNEYPFTENDAAIDRRVTLMQVNKFDFN